MEQLTKTEAGFREIRDQVIECRRCPLYKARTYPVIGEGSHQAKIMFIGEAPGFNEDRTGRPFCGAAGRVLGELLDSVGLKREEVYIANILKCRPPANRDPRPEEIRACVPYLERQIELLAPKIICGLGNYSVSFIFKKYGLESRIQGISRIHGRVFRQDASGAVKIIPLYHPAVAVYNPNMKEILKKDFEILKNEAVGL